MSRMLQVPTQVTWGTDPEGFFQHPGLKHIIGSENVVPTDGIVSRRGSKIVRDGVQFELQPLPSRSVLRLGDNLSEVFRVLERLERSESVNYCAATLVELSAVDFSKLSPLSRVLACNESENIYGILAPDVDGEIYHKRSAGGHIHIGLTGLPIIPNGERYRLVPLCDILVANTCVMLDRDPGSAERREIYGRVGEYRVPRYGLEYRTLSNFWLRSYALMSFVFGMTAVAISVLTESLMGRTQEGLHLDRAFLKLVDIKQIIAAVQTNNVMLAERNFRRIVPFLKGWLPSRGFPLSARTVELFPRYAEIFRNRGGVNFFFPEDRVVANWSQRKFIGATRFFPNIV